MSIFRSLICFLVCAFAASAVHAGVLRLDPSAKTVKSGEKFSLQLFFDETVDPATGIGDISMAGGLGSAGARILVDAGISIGSGPPPLVVVNNATLNPEFDAGGTFNPPSNIPELFPAPPGFSNLIGFFEFDIFSPPVTPTGGTVLLAEFEMTITAARGTRVEFSPATLDIPNFQAIVGADMRTLFDESATTENAIVTINGVVPEPGSMLIWAGLLGAPILVRRRRNKKSSALAV